ncbi:MAG: DUF1570 domain-containing protein [Planctomycetota bacterium]|nr:DUF1570 domain-containing protein [Planctomycetota bacterium]
MKIRRKARLLTIFGLISLFSILVSTASANDVIVKHDGGRLRGKILKENKRTVTIKTLGGVYTLNKSDISKILRSGSKGDEFKRKWKAVDKYDPDALYRLGKWCDTQNLKDDAKRCYEAALKQDSYHRKSREALGYRKWRGKWVTEEDYKALAEGKVKYKGKWMAPEERDMRKQGYEKDEDGKWLRPEDAMRKREWERMARERKRQEEEDRKARREGRKVKKKPGAEGQPRKRPQADTSWYDDNTSTGSFGTAPEIESKFYKIKTNVKKEYAKRYGTMMDQYYVRFAKVFKPFMPKGQIPKSPIYIYSSQREFMSASGMSQYTGGFYSTGNRRVTAYHGKFGQNGNTRTVLAHEGTHQFQHIVLGGGFGNAPIWIIEGLAVFFESAYYNGKKVEIALVPADRLSNLKRGAAGGTLIPFHDLIRTSQQQFTAYHYAHGWGLIYYMLYGSKDKKTRKKRLKQFTDLLFLAKKRKVQPEDTENVFGGKDKFLKFEEEWKKWVVNLPYDFDPRGS